MPQKIPTPRNTTHSNTAAAAALKPAQGTQSGLRAAQEVAAGSSFSELKALESFAALCRLVVWALKFTPLVALDAQLLDSYKQKNLAAVNYLHYGLTLDLSGTERVHHGLNNLVGRIIAAFARKNMAVKIATAPTYGAAWALARFSRAQITTLESDARLESVLAPLPLAALQLTQKTCLALEQFGIHCIQQLRALPPKTLGARFGAEILTRLERTFGEREEPLPFAKVKEQFLAERSFEVPLLLQAALRHACLELFKELLQKLQLRNKQARAFTINIFFLDAEREQHCYTREVALYHASNNIEHVSSVITPILERLKTAEGVFKIALSAHLLMNLARDQQQLMGQSKKDLLNSLAQSQGQLVNQLLIRLGKTRVVKVCFENSWIPERSFSYHSALLAKDKQLDTKVAASRPPYLLNPPQAVSVLALLPDAVPARIAWDGKLLKVLQGLGPERISSEWWKKTLTPNSAFETRDYFKIQDETGRWLWIFREHASAKWFVHGLWA